MHESGTFASTDHRDADTPHADQWAAERQAAYDTVRGSGQLELLRRFTTLDRVVKSWPRFGLWTLVVAVGYYLAGYGYWDFRDGSTGRIDWLLVTIYWIVCASVVWLCWPAPPRQSRGGSEG